MNDHPQTTSATAIVKAMLAALAAKDYDLGLQSVAPDCEYDNVPLYKVTGPAGVRAVLEPFFAPTLRNEFIYHHEAEADGLVFIERTDRHLLPTGWVELPVMGVFKVENGLVTLWRDYFDANTIMAKWPQPG